MLSIVPYQMRDKAIIKKLPLTIQLQNTPKWTNVHFIFENEEKTITIHKDPKKHGLKEDEITPHLFGDAFPYAVKSHMEALIIHELQNNEVSAELRSNLSKKNQPKTQDISDVVDGVFMSKQTLKPKANPLFKYMNFFLGNPIPKSNASSLLGKAFPAATRATSSFPLYLLPFASRMPIALITKMRRDAYVLTHQSQPVGYAAFEIKNNCPFENNSNGFSHSGKALHLFAMDLIPFYLNHGLGKKMAKSLIEHARKNNISYVRMGGGRNHYTNVLYEKLQADPSLGVQKVEPSSVDKKYASNWLQIR